MCVARLSLLNVILSSLDVLFVSFRDLLERELDSVGIRLNTAPPNIYFKIKKAGGISFNSTMTLTHVDEKLVYLILHEYKVMRGNDADVKLAP
jgi:ribosome-interacting GTPase 1